MRNSTSIHPRLKKLAKVLTSAPTRDDPCVNEEALNAADEGNCEASKIRSSSLGSVSYEWLRQMSLQSGFVIKNAMDLRASGSVHLQRDEAKNVSIESAFPVKMRGTLAGICRSWFLHLSVADALIPKSALSKASLK